MSILPADYYTQFSSLGLNPILSFLLFVVQFYIFLFIFIILNALLTACFCWSLLVIYRILGIPWIDGTTKGFINRS